MNSHCELWILLVITAASASLSGCGSSRVSTTSQAAGNSVETNQSFSNSVSTKNVQDRNTLQSKPISIIQGDTKSGSLASEDYPRDGGTGALELRFADLDLKSTLSSESFSEADLKRIPESLTFLNGQKIRISGYMLPTFEETGIEAFCLDRSARVMNFGAPIKPYEFIEVHLSKGTTTEFVSIGKPIDVVGVFQIDPLLEDGDIHRLYVLNEAAVLPKKLAK